MKFIACALIAVCLVGAGNCRVVRDTAATTTTTNTFNDLATEAERTITNLHGKFLEFWGVKSNDELTTLVQTTSTGYADRLKTLVTQIGEETKNSQGTIQTAARGFSTKVTEIISEIQEQNPELTKESQKLQEAFESRLRVVLTEAEKFGKVIKESSPELQQNFETLTKQIIDNTVETAKAVSTQVEAAVKKS